MVKRYTGATPIVRMTVVMRGGGNCEICNKPLNSSQYVSLHHRKPRKMGGSRDTSLNEASNLMMICGSGTSGCHGYVESNRELSYTNGWLVHSYEIPNQKPVLIRDKFVVLDDEGNYV
jgi:5-methylcytosine-specific restriction enzyme A